LLQEDRVEVPVLLQMKITMEMEVLGIMEAELELPIETAEQLDGEAIVML
jgi:hypothetical protein